jgi:hypothetical protein
MHDPRKKHGHISRGTNWHVTWIFSSIPIILSTGEVWSSGLGTVGRDPGNKPVLVYLTGSLFTTDNQLIAPQVRKSLYFQCICCLWSCTRIWIVLQRSEIHKYYSLSAVKIWDHTKHDLKGNWCWGKPHIMWNTEITFIVRLKTKTKTKNTFCVSRLWEAPYGRFIFVGSEQPMRVGHVVRHWQTLGNSGAALGKAFTNSAVEEGKINVIDNYSAACEVKYCKCKNSSVLKFTNLLYKDLNIF